ncbi:MAG: NAD(P)/FAD-dependent oxidoreductase, partial [Candidatus Omnitrophica bacterium]|nr:NAD(P)/FAD-dependent oxidoreductase [Candidatus Omnitrophota bacterium]
RGLKLKVERGGRIFPETDRASSVVEILTDYLIENGVKILFNSRVKEVLIKDKTVQGVKLYNGKVFSAKRVIVATGGKSYAWTGSSGDGYEIARELGHRVTKLSPALVPLITRENFVKELQGLSLKNVRASVMEGGKPILSEFGEMLFTHFGLSGPIILSLSGDIVDLLEEHKEIVISIDLKPALNKEQLQERIIRDVKTMGRKIFKNYLKELLPVRLIPIVLRILMHPCEKKINQLSRLERERLIELLKNFRLTVIGTRSWEEAMVTRGGVSVKEINPQTMESKLIKGLFFCGEVMDIDAKTGGYNLQGAFSTGYIAGESAANSLRMGC